jgi:hypothetical protein
MEELGVKPDQDTVRRVARAFQKLGQEEKQKLVLKRYKSKWKYIHFKGERVRARTDAWDEDNAWTRMTAHSSLIFSNFLELLDLFLVILPSWLYLMYILYTSSSWLSLMYILYTWVAPAAFSNKDLITSKKKKN